MQKYKQSDLAKYYGKDPATITRWKKSNPRIYEAMKSYYINEFLGSDNKHIDSDEFEKANNRIGILENTISKHLKVDGLCPDCQEIIIVKGLICMECGYDETRP